MKVRLPANARLPSASAPRGGAAQEKFRVGPAAGGVEAPSEAEHGLPDVR
jgi:hypothetical protein